MRLTTKRLRAYLLQTASTRVIGEVHAVEALLEAIALQAFLDRSRTLGD